MNYWKTFSLRRLSAGRRWLLPILATAAFALGVYVVALRYLFPYAELSRWLEARLLSSGLEAKVEGLGPNGLKGFRAERIVICPPGVPERGTEIRGAVLDVSLLSLLRLQPRMSLDAETLGGRVEADFTLRAPQRLEARWDNVELSRAPLPPDWSAIGLFGRATGGLETEFATTPGPRPAVLGTLETRITGAKLGPGDLRGLPLPGVSLGNGQIRVVARGNRVDVEAFHFEGGNLDLNFSGRIDLSGQTPAGAVDGLLTLNPRGRTAEDLGFLLSFFPGPRASDGTYAAHVGGSPGSLILSPTARTP